MAVEGQMMTTTKWRQVARVQGGKNTYVDFSINDVNKTAQNDDEIKHVPSVSKVILRRKEGTRDQGQRNVKLQGVKHNCFFPAFVCISWRNEKRNGEKN